MAKILWGFAAWHLLDFSRWSYKCSSNVHTASTSMTDYFNCFWPVHVSTCNTRLSFFDQKVLFTDLKSCCFWFPGVSPHSTTTPLKTRGVPIVLIPPGSSWNQSRDDRVAMWRGGPAKFAHGSSVWAYTCLKALKFKGKLFTQILVDSFSKHHKTVQ